MTLTVCIELLSSSARVTPVKSTQGLSVTDGHPDPKIGPQVYLGPIKNEEMEWERENGERMRKWRERMRTVSYTHLRAHET